MASINVELRHLRAFVAVAQTSNFTRAAEQLMISQPSLSHTIRQLETTIGVQLFNRTTRATALTPDGEIFLDEAKAVLHRFEDAIARTRRMVKGELGRLRVGYLIGAAVDHVPAILRAFATTYPDVDVEITEYDFTTPNGGIDVDETDVAIVRPPMFGVPKLIKTLLLTEPRVACVSETHLYASMAEIPLKQILLQPIVAAPGDNAWRNYWTLNDYRDSPPPITHEAATFEAEMQAVAFGRGISVVPESAEKLYARPGVRFVPIAGISPCEVAVVRRIGSPQSAANFAKLAREVLAAAEQA